MVIKMKIAFIVNEFPSISQTFILNQITGLLDLGHKVEIFSQNYPVNKKFHPDIEKYKLMEKVHYFEKVPKNKIIRVLKAIYLIFKNFHIIALKKILNSLNVFKFGREALSLKLFYMIVPFLNKGFDIIQCHFGPNGNIGAFLKQLGIDGMLVTMFHGYDIRFGIEIGTKIYHQLFTHGDCFLSISNYNYKNLVRFGVNKEKIIFHPVGIDINNFQFKWQERNKAPSPIIVLTVARLVEEKGLKYSIMAINEIFKKNLDLTLKYYIVGEGLLDESLKKLVKKLELEDDVKFLGVMNRIEVAREMSKAHIFLLPSVAEALPVVLMEAQAIGLPVIATNVGSVEEVVIDQKSGFIVSAKDVDAIAEKLEYLIDHPDVWPEMGRYGRKIVEGKYDINKLNQQLLKIYQNLLKKT